jgi:quercetin dioxygenase-like cupin family protein
MRIRILLAAVVIAGTGVGLALATPPSGTRSVDYAATGAIAQPFHANVDRIKLQTKGEANVVTQAITYGPGASSGWHEHVGVVVVVVKDGAVTRYLSNCAGETFTQGDVFVETSDLGPMVLRNETSANAHVAATFITNPPVPQNLRIDVPNPGCPQS